MSLQPEKDHSTEVVEKEEEINENEFYTLNVSYNNWNEETEPFPFITSGDHNVKAGTKISIPIIGGNSSETKEGNKKDVIAIGFSTVGDEYRNLMSRVNSRCSSFTMPSCNVNMWIVFSKK